MSRSINRRFGLALVAAVAIAVQSGLAAAQEAGSTSGDDLAFAE